MCRLVLYVCEFVVQPLQELGLRAVGTGAADHVGRPQDHEGVRRRPHALPAALARAT